MHRRWGEPPVFGSLGPGPLNLCILPFKEELSRADGWGALESAEGTQAGRGR